MPKSKIQDLLDLISPHLENDPETAKYVREVFEALERCSSSLGKVKPASEDGLAALSNLLVTLWVEIGEAGDSAGISPTSEEARASVRRRFEHRRQRQTELGEMRAIKAALFQKYGWGWKASELRPMFYDYVTLEQAMEAVAFSEGLPFESAETIRRSISRTRRKYRGKRLYKFDAENLTVESSDAERVLFEGLPKRSGRPRGSK